jgi:lipopolysaccharide transport system permease protein
MQDMLTQRLGYLYKIWQLRYFWSSLAVKDLTNRYKRSFLGIGWSMLRPLAMTCIFCVVFGRLFHYPIEEYAPYLLISMTIWQFLTESILQGSYSFARCSPYVRQQPIPLAIFPLTTVLGSAFHSLIALAMAIGVTLFFKGSIDPISLLYLIPSLVIVFLLGWLFAIISGVIHTHFPDTNHLLEIGLQVLFYVTPILYRPESFSDREGLSFLVEWNPLSSIMALVRTPILDGTLPALHQIQMSLLVLTLAGACAILLLRKLERTLIFWI